MSFSLQAALLMLRGIYNWIYVCYYFRGNGILKKNNICRI